MKQRVQTTSRPRRSPASPRPTAFYSVRRLDQVRALAHPLRLRLLELFAMTPRTTKQAAEILGEKPTRLYHHVARLEAVGLLRLKETRRKRGTTEKYYEAVASLVSIDSSLFRSTGRGKARNPELGMAVDLLESAKEELAAWPPDAKTEIDPAVMRVTLRGSTIRLAAFREELMAWMRTWGEAAEGEGDPDRLDELTMTLALVPSLPRQTRRRPG